MSCINILNIFYYTGIAVLTLMFKYKMKRKVACKIVFISPYVHEKLIFKFKPVALVSHENVTFGANNVK